MAMSPFVRLIQTPHLAWGYLEVASDCVEDTNLRESIFSVAVACVLAVVAPMPTQAEVTLRVVPHSDLKILDPIWTPSYITRNHGYMIYDTLFAAEEAGEIRPQMLEKYEVSGDKLHTHSRCATGCCRTTVRR
jgi:hypothetical protein